MALFNTRARSAIAVDFAPRLLLRKQAPPVQRISHPLEVLNLQLVKTIA
jgi:hypothetical protein